MIMSCHPSVQAASDLLALSLHLVVFVAECEMCFWVSSTDSVPAGCLDESCSTSYSPCDFGHITSNECTHNDDF